MWIILMLLIGAAACLPVTNISVNTSGSVAQCPQTSPSQHLWSLTLLPLLSANGVSLYYIRKQKRLLANIAST